MGWRWRRRIKVAPGVHLNVSSSGVGASAGVKGARVTVGPKGRVTQTTSIPGTGIYNQQVISSGQKSPAKRPARKAYGCLKSALLLAAILFGATMLATLLGNQPQTESTAPQLTITPTVVRLLPAQPIIATLPAISATDTSVLLPTNTPPPTDVPPPTNTPMPTETPIPPPTATPTTDYSPRPLPADFTPLAAPAPAPVDAQRSAPAIELPTPLPPPSAGASSCDCSGDNLNCADFDSSGWSAQACFLRCGELTGSDIHRLDGDNDGDACEWHN